MSPNGAREVRLAFVAFRAMVFDSTEICKGLWILLAGKRHRMRDGLEQQHEPKVYDSGLLAQRLIVIERIMDQGLDRRVEVPRSACCMVLGCALKEGDINIRRGQAHARKATLQIF